MLYYIDFKHLKMNNNSNIEQILQELESNNKDKKLLRSFESNWTRISYTMSQLFTIFIMKISSTRTTYYIHGYLKNNKVQKQKII